MSIPAAMREQQQLAARHLSKLKFDRQLICKGDQEFCQYLEALGITSQKAIKLVTEAALLGASIEHGLSPDLIIRAGRSDRSWRF